MSGLIVQLIVFSLSGIIIITGIYLIIKGNKIEKAPYITIFTVGFLLLIIASINPYEIFEIKASGKGIHITRHQPSEKERDVAIKIWADKPVKISEEEKEKFIREAKLRLEEQPSPVDYLVLTTEAWQEKKYDDALKFAYIGLNLKPDDTRVKATLILWIGSVYESLKIPDLAIKYYENAIGEDPTFSRPHIYLGNLYRDQKRYVEAEKECKKTIELDPKFAGAYNNLGVLYFEQKRYEEAEREYKKAVVLDPEDAIFHSNLGYLYSSQGKLEEAEREYKKVIELDPNNESVREYLKFLQSLIGT